MVAFSDIPMSSAISRSAQQEDLLCDAIAEGQFKHFGENDCIKQAVKEYFEPILSTTNLLSSLHKL